MTYIRVICFVLLLILILVVAGIEAMPSPVHSGGGGSASASKAPDDINPPLLIKTHQVGRVSRRVVRDDALFAGTKQRAILPYVRRMRFLHPLADTLMYTGGHNGYGPTVTALGASLSGMKCRLVLDLHAVGRDHGTLVSAREAKDAPPVQKSLQMGAGVEFADSWKALVQMGKQFAQDPQVLWAPLGLDDAYFVACLARALRRASSPEDSELLESAPIYVAGGVGAVARAIHGAFGGRDRRDRRDHKGGVVAVAAASVGKLRAALKKFGIGVAHPPKAEVRHAVPTVRGYDSATFDAVGVLPAADAAIIWNVAGGPFRKCDLVAPPASAEDIRSENYRRFQRALYLALAPSLTNPDSRARLAKLVPDATARRVFAAYVRGKKGDPLLPAPEEFDDEYRDAILKQMHARKLNFDESAARAALGRGEQLLAHFVGSAANGAEPDDVPAHVMKRLEVRCPGPNSHALAWFVRYASLGALGHQMAMPDAPKNLIVDALGGRESVAELFASAVNATLPRYFSMFEDVERPFGSLGAFDPQFLSKTPLRSFIANPPYDEAMLEMMVGAFLAALAGGAVTVAFGMPLWEDFEPLRKVRGSEFLRAEVVFADKEVSWINYDILGTKTTRARIPAHAWFLLSSGPPNKKFETLGRDLRRAWAAA